MADKDELNNDTQDEYQFSEIDPLEANTGEDETISAAGEESPPTRKYTAGAENHVKRNALIAVVGFLVFMLLYKFIGSFFGDSKSDISNIKPAPTSSTPLPQIQPAPVTQSEVPTAPEATSLAVAPIESSNQYTEMKSSLSSLLAGQEKINMQVATVGNQFDDVETKINQLTTQITALNQTITGLNDKLENQAKVIQQLSAKQVKPAIRHYGEHHERHLVRYFIQAVIPGRAWLVSHDGNTLTVREGSRVPGYGMVRLIDANQGRILTSSGLVIRFSQDDS